jgi:hypothetical protein
MTTCSTNACGLGGFSGPLPGDPDNNSILSATPAFGGIDVSWTYPTTNPQAVAHTILYRGVLPDFNSAIVIATMGGNIYYDKATNEQAVQQYYWIRIVSVNGTVGELIGPASAIARPTIEVVLEQLAGRIDAGTLAQTLKTELDRIELNAQAITQESAARVAANTAYSVLMTQVQAGVSGAYSVLNQEIAARQDGDSTLVAAINTAQSAMGGNLATAQIELQTSINTVDQKVGALYTAKVNVNGLIGGFGIYNDGSEVQAGFDVDTFWIGRTSNDKVKPFIIEGGVVYMNAAVVKDGTIGSAKIADSIQSVNFSSGLAGWRITKAGTLELNGTRMQITNSVIAVRDDNGVERVRIGTL